MSDFKERVKRERKTLSSKIDKLLKFTQSDVFKQLTIDEQNRLADQLHVMEHYEEILMERIVKDFK